MLDTMLGMDRVAVTFTGGVESTVLAYELMERQPVELHLLCCNYGQASYQQSSLLLKKHTDKLSKRALDLGVILFSQELEVSVPYAALSPLMRRGYAPKEANHTIDYTEQRKSYDYALLDGRNAFLFLHMLAYCSMMNVPVLYSGHQYEPKEWAELDSYRHRTEDFGPGFIDRMNLLQEVGFHRRVRIEAPYLLGRFSKADVMKRGLAMGLDIRNDTYSCQFYPECGKCDNCICRENSLREAKA